MRLAVMGTPDFAVPAFEALRTAGHEIVAAYCQPPRPAGRGHKLQPSPVQRWAETHGIPVRTPTSLKRTEEQAAFAALDLDAAVVAAYGLILPKPVLEAPRLGCINIHASLLPRWRGAAPIQRAIVAGDSESGVTIMAMDEGLDTGAMLLTEATPIGPETTGATLHDALAAIGARLIGPALAGLADGSIRPRPQPADGATYARKLERAESRLDWRRDAAELERTVRAFDPWPGTVLMLEGEAVKLLAAGLDGRVDGAEPGCVVDDRFGIACGNGGVLRPVRLQRPGRASLALEDFLRGRPVAPGTRLALPDLA